MAISQIRRAIIISFQPVLRIVGGSSHLTTTTTSTYLPRRPAAGGRLPNSTAAVGYLFESRRYISNTSENNHDHSRKHRFELASCMDTRKSDAISKMDAAIDILSCELNKLITGRASLGMFDNFMLEAASVVKMPLYQVANVSVLDSQTISITPFPLYCNDEFLENLRKWIALSPLGLNPKLDATNKRLIISIPLLTEEDMQATCDEVTKSFEIAKERITNACLRARLSVAVEMMTPGFSDIEDMKHMNSEWRTKIEALTQKYIRLAEDICELKKNEITSTTQGHSLLAPVGFMGSLPN